MSLSRAVYNALLPGGAIWDVESDSDFDKLLDGLAAGHDSLTEDLKALASIRDPLLTTLLSDLEVEFGIVPDSSVGSAVRRARLLAAKTAANGTGTLEFLQKILQTAGFPVYLYANNPPVDPQSLLGYVPSDIFGNALAIFGNGACFGSNASKGMLVNGPLYYGQALVTYSDVMAAHYWPLVFFVGGAATYLDDGGLAAIAPVDLPISRKDEFIRTIIKLKPLHTWVGLLVSYI